uniref:XK-related protein n=1 Tax=Zonotrichia albicollis TaxID=44394 RepID=A0A8D2N3Q2_ZONAL
KCLSYQRSQICYYVQNLFFSQLLVGDMGSVISTKRECSFFKALLLSDSEPALIISELRGHSWPRGDRNIEGLCTDICTLVACACSNEQAFISHDISMLRLFETFLENTPQLTLLLYIVLRTNKAEISQGLGMVTAFLCVSWSLLDYHQSLRSFLQDKYELSRSSSIVYFLWNLFLICPRILALALFALLWPYGMAVHFSLLWLAMFLWVSLQGTDFMESPGSEQLYRAMVAVILYFSWFNVAQGRTLHRSIIYHGFMLVDSTLLGLAWLWGRPPEEEEEHSYLIPVVSAALPCYLLGLGLRVTYYKWLHPNVRVRQEGRYDEVDQSLCRAGPAAPPALMEMNSQ